MTVAPAPTPLAARIDAVLAGFVDGQRLLWPDDDLRPMLDTVRRFILTGGKRLRPAFCYWGWRGVAAPEEQGEDQAAVTAGAALELFHCFALIHDDIIDAGSRRRGQPSMHEEFAAAHAAHGWRGDARSFGRNTALLCGDLCAMWAEELLAGCPATPVRLAQAQRLFAVMRAEAVAGEYLEVVAQAMGDFGSGARQRAARVMQLKTARYSVVRPLQIGAVLAGASDAVLDGLSAFGEPLGEAFQLRDDVLGVFGDPARTGKSVLDDLRQAKPTTLLAEAFARGDVRSRAVLSAHVGDAGLDEAGAAQVRAVMAESGALAAVEERIEAARAESLRALEFLELAEESRQALGALADFVASRSV
ncbi:polyprenyl synthetase family protein [Catellatospora methionotrophica]|uniref:polyprenyl synthetase family protein n=1 Tax=Catellatospora methionotrophica TaxID=121620 RepID=UPI0033DE6C9F